jgi:hypothetical protein
MDNLSIPRIHPMIHFLSPLLFIPESWDLKIFDLFLIPLVD